jgi:hypothetical protein
MADFAKDYAHTLLLVGSVAVSLSLLTWIGTYPTADAGAPPPLIAADLRPIKVWVEVEVEPDSEPKPVEALMVCPEWTICPSPPKPEQE